MPAADGEPRRDVVALGELVVDRDVEIGNARAVALDHLGQAVGAADAFGMQHVVIGDEVGKRVEVPGGRLREAVADHGLVVLVCAHARTVAGAARHSIGGTTHTATGLSEAVAHGVRSRLGAATQSQLREDVGDVVLRGARADHEAIGDLGVRAAFCEQAEHLALAAGQQRCSARPCASGGFTEAAQQGGRRVCVRLRAEPIERRDRQLAFPHGRRRRGPRERARELELRPRGL